MHARFIAAFVALAFTFGLLGPAPAGAITGHPTKTNVGVPPGASLTAYTGPTTITSCGVTIANKYIVNSDLDIRAGNGFHDEAHPCVTLQNVLIYGGVIDTKSQGSGYGPLVVNDTSIVNLATRDIAGISNSNYYLHRVMITGARSGAQTDGYTVIKDSYLEATREYCPRLHGGTADCQHLDAFITNGMYGAPAFLQNDTFLCNPTQGDPVEVGAGCAADVGLFADNSVMSNVNIWGSLFKATDAAFYCISGPELGPPKIPGSHDVILVGNEFETNGPGSCGHVGNIDNGWSNTNNLQCQNYFVGTTTNAMPSAPNC